MQPSLQKLLRNSIYPINSICPRIVPYIIYAYIGILVYKNKLFFQVTVETKRNYNKTHCEQTLKNHNFRINSRSNAWSS